MVHMKNIRQNGHLVSFDGYINCDKDKHFTMTVDLDDSSKSIISIKKCYDTDIALVKIMRVYAEKGSLPEELVAVTH